MGRIYCKPSTLHNFDLLEIREKIKAWKSFRKRLDNKNFSVKKLKILFAKSVFFAKNGEVKQIRFFHKISKFLADFFYSERILIFFPSHSFFVHEILSLLILCGFHLCKSFSFMYCSFHFLTWHESFTFALLLLLCFMDHLLYCGLYYSWILWIILL